MTSAALVGQTLYVAGGQESMTATEALKNFWALDLEDESPAWRTLKPWPGPGRILAVAAARGRSVYLFSGAELVVGEDGGTERRYLTDAYRYDVGIGWARVADLPRPAVAAPSPAMVLGAGRILLFGGDDGANAGKALELKDEHPGFPRSILAYDPQADAWSAAGEMPAGHVTTPLVYWRGMHVLPSGEIRPGVRSPKVLAVKPTE
jgi:N-acetylneuraminic acid mutarotase